MDFAEIIIEILKYVLPAGLVLFGVKLVQDRDSKKEDRKERLEIRSMALSKLMPLRLQAYERAILFLERISPENLLLRIPAQDKTAKAYQVELSSQIRSEFEHNMAQQLYISMEGWMELVTAKEQTLALIHQCTSELGESAKGTDLARRIIERVMQTEVAPARKAINTLKIDIHKTFRLIP